MSDLVASLLPLLGSRTEEEFNVFDVMRHGTHEKQLSNVFAWLLDSRGTHRLGDRFQRIFIDAVNRGLGSGPPIAQGAFSVRQEVDTSGNGTDIADIILEDHETTIVIENYYTSDGHGHDYLGYERFGASGGKRSVVVMLCETENRTALAFGWEHAPVVVYANLLRQLSQHVESDSTFRSTHPDQCAFFDHMHRRFVKGRKVNDENLVEFLTALCKSGEAQQFGAKNRDDAAINLGDRLREEAIERFNASRELLARVKRILRAYGESTLVPQLNAALSEARFGEVSARYQGIYEWTVNFYSPDDPSELQVQFKFGPSAWNANESDAEWLRTVERADADYSKLFVTSLKDMAVMQSVVSMQEVLDGLPPDDVRLRDEILGILD